MELSRRKFIRAAGLLSIGFAAVTTEMSCFASKSFTNEKDRIKFLNALEDDLLKIIYLGSLASSSHNSQPWKIQRVSDDQLRISVDTNRLLPAIDPNHHETILSIGAFLENMIVAGKSLGYGLSYSTENERDIHSFYIDVFLKKLNSSKVIPTGLLKRRSLRKNHLSMNIDEKHLDKIIQNKRAKFFPKNSQQSKIIEALTLSATELQIKNRKIMKELSEWIRWDTEEIKMHQDGLTPETMEISGLPGFWVKMFYDKSSVMTESFAERTIALTKEQLSSYGGWLLISSIDHSYAELLKAGRSMEAMFIHAAENRLGFHIMLQLLQEQETKNKFIRTLQLKKEPQFLIRVSHLEEYPGPVSPRRDLNKIIL